MGHRKEIAADINTTLDQLLENQKILNRISNSPHLDQELSILRKMQESLLAHLLYLDNYLKEKQGGGFSQTAHEKLLLFGRMNRKLVCEMERSYVLRKKGQIKNGRSYRKKRKLAYTNNAPVR